ncbi:hypothetical protein [Sinimarinibacterium thermocellulolyticum]|uniref:Secreted protein n=1 Tax=Sinimarinibacterium thermocellulolyticum TaxID=3170016 RepID=A0ABV2AAU3_9GAMM
MKRKTLQIVLLSITASGAIGTVMAQPPHDRPPTHAVPSAQAEPTFTGTVKQYLLNPHGEVDGLLLDDGSQVKFPPHLGEELAATARPGDTVSVQGWREGHGEIKAYAITGGSGVTVVDRPPAWHERKPPKHWRQMTLSPMSAQGVVQHLLFGKHGEIKGVVLDDGTIVRFPRPKHTSHMLSGVLRVGEPLSAHGYGTENAYGRVLEAESVSAGGRDLPLYHR